NMSAKYILRKNNSDAANVRGFVARCRGAGIRKIVVTPDFREIAQRQVTGDHLRVRADGARGAAERDPDADPRRVPQPRAHADGHEVRAPALARLAVSAATGVRVDQRRLRAPRAPRPDPARVGRDARGDPQGAGCAREGPGPRAPAPARRVRG